MRTIWMMSAALGLALQTIAAAAQAPGRATVDNCQGRRALGVSRTVAIDTAQGPRFGHQQYKELSFLKEGEVVLTFDDGPLRTYTRPVLEALDAHCTKATFFMVGRMAVADPEMVREVARRGHTIGTHTYTHRNLRSTNQVNARHEIELAISAVQKAAGVPTAPFFRFPYLSDPAHTQSYLQTRGIAMFSIEVDAYDYRTQAPDQMHRNVLSQLSAQGKGIILWHDIQPSTAGGLRRLLDDLAARNFKVVHIVPRQPVETLPAFDALAERELSKRRSVIAAQPLAQRSVVWSAGPAPSATIGAGDAAGPRPSAGMAPLPRGQATPAPTAQRPLPPPPSAFAPVPAPAPVAEPAPPPIPAARPQRADRRDPSWQERAFGAN